MAHRFRRIIPGIGKAEGLSAIRGFTRWVTCMYPISLVFDSLRKQTRTLRAKFEEAPGRDLEPVRGQAAISPSRTTVSRCTDATLGFVGIGFFTAIFLSPIVWNGTTTLPRGGPYPLTCQRMTVSLINEGKLVAGGEAADQRANIPCTAAMIENSQLCRDKCAADAP